jgi:hypothetical protein
MKQDSPKSPRESLIKADVRQCIDGLVDVALASDPDFTAAHATIVKELIFRTLEQEPHASGLLKVAELTRSTITLVTGKNFLGSAIDQRLAAQDERRAADPRAAGGKIEKRLARSRGGDRNFAIEAFRHEIRGLRALLSEEELQDYLGIIAGPRPKLSCARERSRSGQLATFGDLEFRVLKTAKPRMLKRIEDVEASLPESARKEEEQAFRALCLKVGKVNKIREMRSLLGTVARIEQYYWNLKKQEKKEAKGIWEDIFSFFSGQG